MAESFNNQSPYLYAYNNPVRFIDYMGMNSKDNVKDDDDVKKEQQQQQQSSESKTEDSKAVKIVNSIADKFFGKQLTPFGEEVVDNVVEFVTRKAGTEPGAIPDINPTIAGDKNKNEGDIDGKYGEGDIYSRNKKDNSDNSTSENNSPKPDTNTYVDPKEYDMGWGNTHSYTYKNDSATVFIVRKAFGDTTHIFKLKKEVPPDLK